MPSKLSALLVQDRVVGFRQMDAAVQRQAQVGGRIGTALLELGHVDEGILLYYMSKQREVAALDPHVFTEVDADALAIWDEPLARELMAIPIQLDRRRLLVATCDPLPATFVEAFEQRTGLKLDQALIMEARFWQALRTFYGATIPDRYVTLIEQHPVPMGTRDGTLTTTGPQISLSGRGEAPESPDPRFAVAPVFEVDGPEIPGLAWSVPELTAFFQTSSSRDQMLLAALGFSGKYFVRRALFVVASARIRGFALQMPGAPSRPVERAEVPFAPDSPVGRLVSGESYFYGALTESGLAPLYEQLGLAAPADLCAIPVKVGPRAALLLVGDGAEAPIDPQSLPVLFLVVNRLSAGLERLIRRQKLRRTASTASVDLALGELTARRDATERGGAGEVTPAPLPAPSPTVVPTQQQEEASASSESPSAPPVVILDPAASDAPATETAAPETAAPETAAPETANAAAPSPEVATPAAPAPAAPAEKAPAPPFAAPEPTEERAPWVDVGPPSVDDWELPPAPPATEEPAPVHVHTVALGALGPLDAETSSEDTITDGDGERLDPGADDELDGQKTGVYAPQLDPEPVAADPPRTATVPLEYARVGNRREGAPLLESGALTRLMTGELTAVAGDADESAAEASATVRVHHQLDTSSFAAAPSYARVTGDLPLVGFRRREEDSGSMPVVAGGLGGPAAIDLDLRLPGVLLPPRVREPSTEVERAFRARIENAIDDQLVEWLSSPDGALADAAFVALLDRGYTAHDALLEHFPGPLSVDRQSPSSVTDPKPLERHGPIVWLVALQLRSLAPRLHDLTASSDADARYYALKLLTQAGDASAVPAIAERLFDPDTQVRETALAFLERHLDASGHGADVRRAARRRLQAKESWVVEQAITAANRLRDIEAVEDLVRLLGHASDRVRQRASQALARLTLQDFGFEQKLWERWWKRRGTAGRNEWLLDAMLAKDWKVRDNAARELRTIPRLVVNYHPGLDRRQLEAARRAVHRHLYGRDGGVVE